VSVGELVADEDGAGDGERNGDQKKMRSSDGTVAPQLAQTIHQFRDVSGTADRRALMAPFRATAQRLGYDGGW
jgi:hypothetical protein